MCLIILNNSDYPYMGTSGTHPKMFPAYSTGRYCSCPIIKKKKKNHVKEAESWE